jgi:class 3 adenylate cyclase
MTAADGGVRPAPAPARDSKARDRQFRHLPWWRRPRRLGRQLAMALVATALLAVATFGGLNFVAARDLLVTGTEQQLAAVGAARAQSIDAGTERLVGEISAASADPGLVGALTELSEAFAALDDEQLTDAMRTELTAWYRERVVAPINAAGLGPIQTGDVVPERPAAQWLQYHYTVRPAGEDPPVDAGDGTEYSALNARVNDAVAAFSAAKGGGDILLIDSRATIVYSLFKRNDVGTNLVAGPYSGTALARLVTERLPQARVGTTLLTDFAVTATGRPALFAVSAVRSGGKVIGAIAVEIPVAALNRVATADGDWEGVGLAEGDSYIVSADLLLQSEPRAWIEDPQGYLDRLRSGDEDDQREADLIEVFGSPVGIQTIDTAPVQTALDGDRFTGSSRSPVGEATFTAAESFDASGQLWVVVSEVPRSVALAPLTTYLLRILLVLAIVLPVVAALGIWLARLLTKPIKPTVEAGDAIVAGERSPDLDIQRRDEFGDLARRLTAMAHALAEREADLEAEYERRRQLLLAVLPPQMVDEDGTVAVTGEAAERATVVAVTVAPADEHADYEQAGEALGRAAALAEEVAEQFGLERVRSAADRSLFLAGMTAADAGADEALSFAIEYRRRLEAEAELALELHIGLASGPVASGVLDTGALTFGAWGEPVRQALAVSSLAQADVVLIDRSTANATSGGAAGLQQVPDVVDLDGRPMDLFTLPQ